MVAFSVISWPKGVDTKLSAIVQICKYKGFYEGHHFIPMAMEMHGTSGHDVDCFIKECAHLFHDKQSKGHLSLSFCIQFFKHYVNIIF